MPRTKGAKNKKPRKSNTVTPVVKLEDKIKEWDAEEARVQVDFQELCEKLQNALAKSYVENDLLEATVVEQRTIIKYLEGKVRESATV